MQGSVEPSDRDGTASGKTAPARAEATPAGSPDGPSAGSPAGFLRRRTLLPGLLVTALIMLAALLRFDQVERLERLLLDWRFLLRGAEQASGDVAIVSFDEASARQLGRWPISRGEMASAVARVAEGGATIIGLDYLLIEPEKAKSGEADPDKALADSIRAVGNVVLAFAYTQDAGSAKLPDFAKAWALARVGAECSPANAARFSDRAQTPLAEIGRAAALGGNVNVDFDVDGAPRMEFLATNFGDLCFAPLPLAAVALHRNVAWNDVAFDFGRKLSIGDRSVRLDGANRILVNYLGPRGTIPTYSFADVMGGRLPPDVFDGKMVFFGVELLGGTDLYRTPFDPNLPGVERNAIIAEQLLHGPDLVQPDWNILVDLLAIPLLGALAALAAQRLPTGMGVATGLGLVLGWFGIGHLALFQGGVWINALYPMVSVAFNAGARIALRTAAEERLRRRAERELRQSEERYALSARGANDGLWDWDLVAGSFYTSPRWHQMLGLDRASLQGKPEDWFDRVHRDDIETLRAAIAAHLAGQSTHLEQEIRMRHEDTDDRWLLVRGMAIRGPSGQATRMAGSLTDITARKLSERQIMFDALHSRLTGLANRALLVDRIDQALQLWTRDKNADVILIILDVDRFGDINETLGQSAGDQVLVHLARALEKTVRPDDTVAHLGEDEFAVLRFAAGDAERQTEQLVGELLAIFHEPVSVGTRRFPISASIGFVVASQAAGIIGDELLRDANLALFRAKTQGRGQAVRFEQSMHQSAVKRFGLEADLRKAVAEGDQLELFYQPIVDIQNDRLHGFEALIRWRHPERGLISPADFIPLAEDTGLIIEIGKRSIKQAARQIAAWMPATGAPPQIAVNVSGRQFVGEALIGDVEKALKKTSIPPASLKLEVTESLIMDNPERTIETLRRIIALGCKVAIDDFGTGYSSLSHLHRFPCNTLKVDRSFVMRVADSKEGLEIVRVISSLAHILERDVVAEGIETEEQLDALRKLGIQFGQGYLFSKPLPSGEASIFLDKWRQKERGGKERAQKEHDSEAGGLKAAESAGGLKAAEPA